MPNACSWMCFHFVHALFEEREDEIHVVVDECAVFEHFEREWACREAHPNRHSITIKIIIKFVVAALLWQNCAARSICTTTVLMWCASLRMAVLAPSIANALSSLCL